jgi:Tol biopolymer transport system component
MKSSACWGRLLDSREDVMLSAGTKLGPHEILGSLGAGGMGEVYLAHDTKLNRRVAIKVLPEAYAADPDRITRFHREAQAVAALNHSGIAAIYDLAEADGTKFLVLELIEGDTLADRLTRGPVPVEEALQIAKQILEALEAAHERGVCHRDLKPANIKLTPDGNVKVLDFGLAKFLQTSPSAPHMTHSPTLSLAGTYPGVILGTAGYMSPEQAKGFEADQRSDIFSFGCSLYELLTGRRAFEGETASEILASVLKSDVDWSALPPRLNPRLVELLHRCLEKNPKKRWHATADVRVELEAIIARGAILEETDREPRFRDSLAKRLAWAALFFAAGLLVAGAVAWIYRPNAAPPITKFVVSLPEGQQFSNTGRQVLALSPDGANLAYVANRRLFIRPMSGLEAREISGTDSPLGPINPVFSPDGQWIAYRNLEGNVLKRIPVSGGAAVVICPTDQIFGVSWHDDAIVFGQGAKGIMRVSPNGGMPEVIATVASDEIADSPQLLPQNHGLIFSVRKTTDTWDKGRVVLQPLDGGARKTLVENGADGRYLPTGHITYAMGGVVMAVPFDLRTTTVKGGPVPMVVGVQRTVAGAGTAAAFFVASANGSAAYVPGSVTAGEGAQTDLALFDRKGNVQRLNLPPAPYAAPRVSPDGQWIAFENADSRGGFISVYELGGASAARRLTFEGNSRAPIWSPDGQWIAFQSDRDGHSGIYRTRADGSGTAEALTKPEAGTAHRPQSWSPDGETLLFSAEKGAATLQSTLWLLTMKDRRTARFGDMAAREATLSPDGRWIAYQVLSPNSSGQVFVAPFPWTGARYLLPLPSATYPFWSAKGDELITITSFSESHATAVMTAPRFAFGEPVPFPRYGRQEENPSTGGRRNSDMLPDGERVIGVLSRILSGQSTNPRIVVVLNWFDELRQRVPIP